MVRAKFTVTKVTKIGEDGRQEVEMSPVITGSDENEKFFEATPSGEIRMGILNKDVSPFIEGTEYYVDFTQVE